MDEQDWLQADCGACAGLCCVVPTFSRSADFADDKPAGTRCQNLSSEQRCTIHTRLRASGYAGCVVFDCFGAGQRLTAGLQPGGAPPLPAQLFGLRLQHQTLWLLREALGMALSAALRRQVQRVFDDVRGAEDAQDTRVVDAAAGVLRRVSSEVRAGFPGPRAEHSGGHFFGADLRKLDLRASSLRGAVLVGARLDGQDLTGADLTGADLRGASLHGADLSRALFVHPSQLEAAAGDAHTRLAPQCPAPAHWTALNNDNYSSPATTTTPRGEK